MRILCSFHYYRDADIAGLAAAFPGKPEIFADSGAYSAYTQQATLSVSEYGDWLEKWSDYFSCYASLDVIHNDAASVANLRELERRGLRPLPVFHGGEPWEQLEEYCQHYTYVCLGGMVASNPAALMGWMVNAFRIGAQHGTVFHGFGQTRQSAVATLPWYSVDSSSWGMGHRFGIVSLWDAQRARFVKVRLGDHGTVYQHAQLIRDHGADPADFATPGFSLAKGREPAIFRAERVRVMACNAVAWLRFEDYLRGRHGAIGPPEGFEMPEDDAPLPAGIQLDVQEHMDPETRARFRLGAGPRVYLAEGNEDNMKMLGRAAGGPE